MTYILVFIKVTMSLTSEYKLVSNRCLVDPISSHIDQACVR